MAASTTVTRGASGTAVLRKAAEDDATAAALRQEAAVLARLAGIDGVPDARLLEPGTPTGPGEPGEADTAPSVRLELDHVGTGDLAARGPLTPHQVVELGARLASLLAEIHGRGVAHGRVTAAHVVLGPSGRASLVGFGGAIEANDLTTAADVADLGALLLAELDRAPRRTAGAGGQPAPAAGSAVRPAASRSRTGCGPDSARCSP